MKPGFSRFEYFLNKVQGQMAQAQHESNPALWLLQNDGRTPFFMLESLAKLYANFHNEKKFDKLKESFKEIEDGLGTLDYYNSFIKEFENIPQVPESSKQYLLSRLAAQSSGLNKILQERRWLGAHATAVEKIKDKLSSADWEKEAKEVKNLLWWYGSSIKDINKFYASSKGSFTEIEEQVHELRRKLRWLSIYPQALRGAIQLTDNGLTDERTAKYLTPEIVNSPYNQMPAAGSHENFLLLEKKYFYALSWLINELGVQKDKGLGIFILAEALQHTENLPQANAIEKAAEILMNDKNALAAILARSNQICSTYFEEGNLYKLISRVAKIS